MDSWQIVMYICTLSMVALAHLLIMPLFPRLPRLPLYLYSIVWAILLLQIIVSGAPYQISLFTYGIFCLAWILLYVGYLVAAYVNSLFFKVRLSREPVETYSFKRIGVALVTIVVLSVLGNYGFYTKVLGELSSLEALVALRTTEGQDLVLEAGGMLFNIFGRIYIIYIPMAFYMYRHKKLSIYWLVALILLALITAAGSLTRAPILFVFIIIFSCIVILELRLKWWTWLLAAFSFVAIILYASMEIFKLQGEEGNTQLLADSVNLYFLGSLVAFENLINGHYFDPNIYDFPYYSLDFVGYFLKKMHIVQTSPSLLRSYTFNLDTNVYTWLDVFALDYGFVGLVMGPFVIGALCGSIAFWLMRRNSIIALSLFCYCCFGLVFSYMNNEFIRSYPVIVFFICLIIDRFCIKNRTRVTTL